jgi:hypothetical protein
MHVRERGREREREREKERKREREKERENNGIFCTEPCCLLIAKRRRGSMYKFWTPKETLESPHKNNSVGTI